MKSSNPFGASTRGSLRHRTYWQRAARGRRRGIAFVYTALFLFVLVGICALVIDMGMAYREKAQMQVACDSAALAGAWQLAHFKGYNTALAEAQKYAKMAENGPYENGVNNCSVLVYYPAREYQGQATTVAGNSDNDRWFRVSIQKPRQTFFTFLFGRKNIMITATAVATYTVNAAMDATGTGVYGADPGTVNLALFGPDGYYNSGDPYSTKYLPGGTSNPNYNPNGLDFQVQVPKGMGNTAVEIFDPDGYNAGGIASPLAGTRIDELWTPSGAVGNSSNITTTKYTLYYDSGTPDDPTDDVAIDSKTYGNTSATDMKWNSVFTLNRDLAAYSKDGKGVTLANGAVGNFRLNVVTTDGESENGFGLRAGPVRTGSTAFNTTNGTKIIGVGHLPINFNIDGTATIRLGTVPTSAAGKEVIIRKFDTDVQAASGAANTVTYTCSTLPGQSWTGKLSGNGLFATDTIPVPSTYTEGTWSVTYSAGRQDTSMWDMSYTGYGPGTPGNIKLIR
ncbi:hypothetical protein IAD21_05299 [Abditibacteriota bacterium]|nr:hypothetical protein IAD21_05299 [Abditibacteriota bacterium]